MRKNKRGKSIDNIIRVDIDIPFDIFMELFKPAYEKAVNAIASTMGFNVLSIRYYASRNNNVHVYITIDKSLDGLDYIIAQFLLHNDHGKTFHNLKRYNATLDPLDLMFHFIE